MNDDKEYVVIVRPFYREQPPTLEKVFAKDKEEALNYVAMLGNVKETLGVELLSELNWNPQVKEKYWAMYR
jgi:hypothetical protein